MIRVVGLTFPALFRVLQYVDNMRGYAQGMDEHRVRVDGVSAGDGRRHEAAVGDPYCDDLVPVDHDAWELHHVVQASLHAA